jgi:hypothetical protein
MCGFTVPANARRMPHACLRAARGPFTALFRVATRHGAYAGQWPAPSTAPDPFTGLPGKPASAAGCRGLGIPCQLGALRASAQFATVPALIVAARAHPIATFAWNAVLRSTCSARRASLPAETRHNCPPVPNDSRSSIIGRNARAALAPVQRWMRVVRADGTGSPHVSAQAPGPTHNTTSPEFAPIP